MGNRIVFGSPEARAILLRDKQEAEWQKLDAEAIKIEGTEEELAQRLKNIDSEIEDLEMEIGCLEDERYRIKEKLKELKKVTPKISVTEWNAWALGSRVTQ